MLNYKNRQKHMQHIRKNGFGPKDAQAALGVSRDSKTSKTQSIPGVSKADLQMFKLPKDTPKTSKDTPKTP